jgi:hypothetical protein
LDKLGHLETSGGRYTIAQARNSRYYLAAINQDIDRAIGMAPDFGNRPQVQLFPGDPTVQDLGNGMSRLTYRLDKLVGVASSVFGNRFEYEELATLHVDVPNESAAALQQYIRVLIEQVREFDLLDEKERERALAEFALRVVPFGSLSIDVNHDNLSAQNIKTAGLDALLTFGPMALARPLRVAGVAGGVAERSVAASYRTVLRGNSETVATTFGERAASVADGGFTNLGNARVSTLVPDGLTSNGLHTVSDPISINVGMFNGFWRRLAPAEISPPPQSVLQNFTPEGVTTQVVDPLGNQPFLEFWRVAGGTAADAGSWMSRTRPISRLQAIEIFALPPGATAEGLVRVRVPVGQVFHEGKALGQFGHLGLGNQIYVPPDRWLLEWFEFVGALPE